MEKKFPENYHPASHNHFCICSYATGSSRTPSGPRVPPPGMQITAPHPDTEYRLGLTKIITCFLEKSG
jgi:hypothetical protein